MNYKLVAIDMDGTLLDSNNQISDKNKNVLKAVNEKGIQVVICTGRLFASARYYAKLLGLITPIIACNGAYVCEYHRNNVLYESALELIDYKKVVKVLEENNMYYHFYDNENFYTKELNYNSLKYYRWNEDQKAGDRINIEVIEDAIEFIDERKPKVYKIVVMDKDDNKLNTVVNQLRENKHIEIVSSMTQSFDIMNKGVSKGEALKILTRKLGVDKSEVIAIGDNYNDIPMFDFAGKSVAMGNGEEKAKKIADIITDTNDNNGVANALEKLILT
ncbi:MAG: HAD family phosphatase [Firmicutes bacterium]|nr:HAD family phosphatase [Bacillota bacterium]